MADFTPFDDDLNSHINDDGWVWFNSRDKYQSWITKKHHEWIMCMDSWSAANYMVYNPKYDFSKDKIEAPTA